MGKKASAGFVRSAQVVALGTFFIAVHATELGKRSEWAIPLVKMTLADDPDDDQFKKVRIPINGDDEYAVITRLSDYYFKTTRNGIEKIQYAEDPDRAFIITDFEGQQMDRVVRSFASTLETFEKDLKKEHWDRCLYLDAFLPRFLKRFYYLVCAARDNPHALPRVARIPDSEFDVSLNSEKSDQRVKMWREIPDYLIKLRIISTELAYQLDKWDKKELVNPTRNPEVAYSAKVEEAYGMFIQIYFNLRPPPTVPDEGQHL